MAQTFNGLYNGNFDGTSFIVTTNYSAFTFETQDTLDSIQDNSTLVGDPIELAPYGDTLTFAGTTSQGIVVENAYGDFLLLSNNSTFQPNASFAVDITSPYTYDVVCFAAGTLIATPDGEKSVETLAIGDILLTEDCGTTPITWIGTRTVHKMFTPKERFTPVRVSAGALGQGLPHSDLVLTADHALIIDGFAINAGALVNDTTITFDPIASLPDRVTYYHIETEAHEVVLANGVAAETFIDYVGRQAFDNYGEYTALYGEDRVLREMPLPRVTAARLLPPAIRARLAGQQAA